MNFDTATSATLSTYNFKRRDDLIESMMHSNLAYIDLCQSAQFHSSDDIMDWIRSADRLVDKYEAVSAGAPADQAAQAQTEILLSLDSIVSLSKWVMKEEIAGSRRKTETDFEGLTRVYEGKLQSRRAQYQQLVA